jgi:hypothetical protein
MSDLLLQQGVVTKEIAGKQYTLKLMSATDAIITGQELVKLLAVPFASAYDSGLLEDELKDMDAGKNIAMALVSSLGKADVITLIKRLVHSLQEDGQVVEFDTFFRGKDNLGKLPIFLSWSIEENGLNPNVFMKGFSGRGEVGFSTILSSMGQKNNQGITSEDLKD